MLDLVPAETAPPNRLANPCAVGENVPPGLDALKHIVVLMMSGRSFDHMLGSLKVVNPQVDGLDGSQWNPDTQGNQVLAQPLAEFQGQLDPSPDSAFASVDQQIFAGDQSNPRVASMQGFVQNYHQQTQDLTQSQKVMYYFTQDKLPVLTSLATNFAIFNAWFASVPGPSICNRSFAHYGTSFGNVGSKVLYPKGNSIQDRLRNSGHTTKIYNFDKSNETMETANLLGQKHPFGTYSQFLADCKSGKLPDYSYVEPNHTTHEDSDGTMPVSSQRPDGNVQAGEFYIASIYNAIRGNPVLWGSTALLVVYDEHGGVFDHVPPPSCTPDGYSAGPADTGLDYTFNFDRLGVRVPAILISPWIPKGTVVGAGRVFEHASIPATIISHFIGNYSESTPREQGAQTFLDLLSLDYMRSDSLTFTSEGATSTEPPNKASPSTISSPTPPRTARASKRAKPAKMPEGAKDATSVRTPVSGARYAQTQPPLPAHQAGPSTHVARDRWTIDDSLGHYPYAYAIYRFLTDPETSPPLAVSIQAPWGGGKTSLMRMIQAQLDPDAIAQIDQTRPISASEIASASVKQVLIEMTAPNPQAAGIKGSGSSARPSWFHFFTKSRAPRSCQPTIPPIEKPGERRVTVWFNAWKYESTAQVWAGLADCMVQQIGKRLGPVERELFWFKLQLRRLDAGRIRRRVHEEILSAFTGKLLSWLPAYLGGLAAIAFATVMHAWPQAGGLLAAELAAAWIQFWKAKSHTEEQPARITLGDFVQAPDYAANLGFIHEVVEDLRHVFQLIPEKHLPMVVFIDDLDRCSPGKIAAVVEAINLFLAGEFPQCMFILGIDDEMVAAALDMAHSDVIAKLPRYARSTSIGWRFMDKFVQLPFMIPPPTPEDLARYVESLLSQGGANVDVSMQARDTAARVVEQSVPTSATPEQVVRQVSSEQALAPEQQQILKKEVAIIQDMNENIKEFTDQDKGIREAISKHANRYFTNPRDTKRFVNLFRFYFFLRAARQASKHQVASVDQLCRWIAFALKWPEVVRWLRGNPLPQDGTAAFALRALEVIAGGNGSVAGWQSGMDEAFGLNLEQTPWLADEDLHAFLKSENDNFEEQERLSDCSNKGLW